MRPKISYAHRFLWPLLGSSRTIVSRFTCWRRTHAQCFRQLMPMTNGTTTASSLDTRLTNSTLTTWIQLTGNCTNCCCDAHLCLPTYHFHRILRANAGSAPLIAIHEGRHAGRDGDDVGPGLFARGLEFCAGVPVQVLGSPNEEFFAKSLPKGITPSECVVIADVCFLLAF